MRSTRDSVRNTDKGAGEPEARNLEDLRREITRLRRTVLKQGHAQELFQGRVGDAVARLTGDLEEPVEAEPPPTAAPGLGAVQLRVLLELGQATTNLRDLAAGADVATSGDEASPLSVREGLDLLEIRVLNLQRSFGLEPIAAFGEPFDDRLHQVHGVCHRSDLADGVVAEEVLPGYLLHGAVQRPALVIVNRLRGAMESEATRRERQGRRDE